MRKCGECRACCKVFPLPALDKPAGTWCRLLGPGGCTVHGGGAQPEVCRLYSCYWLDHESLPEEWRPNLLGLVVTESGMVTIEGRELPVLVVNLLNPDSDRGPAAQAMLQKFLAEGMALLLLHGPDLRIAYDRARYPAITPEGIEEAFRFERSRDAQELRRLGAVDETF